MLKIIKIDLLVKNLVFVSKNIIINRISKNNKMNKVRFLANFQVKLAKFKI